MAGLAATRTITRRTTLWETVKEIALYRELLLNLVRLELKAKYKASALGFAWSLLNPAMYLVVFYIAFDVILGSGIPRFPIYLLSGLLVWNFFTAALNSGTGAVVAAAGLVKKVWFPREILPLASVGAALVHFFLQLTVLVAAVALIRHPIGWAELPLLPLALFDLVLLAAGLAVLLSAANVYMRDMAHFVELALLGWFWMTPIVYPFSQLTEAIGGRAALALLNPVTPIVLAFQRALYGDFGHVLDPNLSTLWYLRNLAVVGVAALVLAAVALRVFNRLEGNLAEELEAMAAAIEVEGVTKQFRLYHQKPTSLKERVLKFRSLRYEHFTALKDIHLDIEAGTTVGLLGHNGSGKSTLLKCMAGILQPTAGVVRTAGRVAALLELGAGFHPELSGRENVYLNGSILGLKRAEVDRVFDDIVGFAELESFIDTPVKHYSSGMYVRLGFAVAINVDPEILLVDEVLSVGDEAFQRKCIDKVKAFQAEGRTIVVVTHAADLVRQLCDKAAALEHGALVAQGDPNEVIREFRERLLKAATPAEDLSPELARSEIGPMWGRVKIADARIVYATPDQEAAAPGESMQLVVTLAAPEPVDDVVVGIAVYNPMGWLVYGTNTDLHGVDLGTVAGRRIVTFDFSEVPLLDGTYAVTVGLHTKGGLVYDSWEQLRRFEVAAPGRDIGIVRLPVDIRVDPADATSGTDHSR